MEAVLEQPKQEQPKMEIVRLNVTDTEIARLKEEYLPLTIAGIDDKVGFKKVFESRQVVKKLRTGLVKFADDLKANALEYQRKVNAEQNRVVGELESIEAHLQAEEDKITAAKEAIKEQAAKDEAARVQSRIDRLAEYGFGIDYETIKVIDDSSFELVLKNAKAEYDREQAEKAEQARLDQIEREKVEAEKRELQLLREQQAAAQKIIEENNARIQKEQDAKDLAQKVAAQKLEAEKKKIEKQKQDAIAETKRQQELQKAREEAAEAARLKAIKDAEEARIKEAEDKRLAQEEAIRQAALLPDKEKLQALADQIGNITLPELHSPAAKEILADVQIMQVKMQAHIQKKIKAL